MAFLSEAAVELALLSNYVGWATALSKRKTLAPMVSAPSAKATMRSCLRGASRMPLHCSTLGCR